MIEMISCSNFGTSKNTKKGSVIKYQRHITNFKTKNYVLYTYIFTIKGYYFQWIFYDNSIFISHRNNIMLKQSNVCICLLKNILIKRFRKVWKYFFLAMCGIRI